MSRNLTEVATCVSSLLSLSQYKIIALTIALELNCSVCVCVCLSLFISLFLPQHLPLAIPKPAGQINTVPMKYQVGYLDVVGKLISLSIQ